MSFKTFIAAAAVVAAASIGAAHANEATRFLLENASGQDIESIYVSPAAYSIWGLDLLGDRVLHAGQAVTIVPGPQGCMFDVRVGYHDETRESFRNVKLCRIARIRFAHSQDHASN